MWCSRHVSSMSNTRENTYYMKWCMMKKELWICDGCVCDCDNRQYNNFGMDTGYIRHSALLPAVRLRISKNVAIWAKIKALTEHYRLWYLWQLYVHIENRAFSRCHQLTCWILNSNTFDEWPSSPLFHTMGHRWSTQALDVCLTQFGRLTHSHVTNMNL